MAQVINNARVTANISGLVTNTYPLNTVQASFRINKSQSLSNGAGNNAVNTEFAADGKISASANVTFNVQSGGGNSGPFNNTIDMAYVKVIAIKNTSNDHGSEAQINITQSGLPFLADSSDAVTLNSGDVFLLTNLRGTGWTCD